MILVIDNYDSFVHNLARYIRLLGRATQVVRNDALTLSEIEAMDPEAIVLSPGPQAPDQAGICEQVVRQFSERVPILGVCLGHQVIVQAFGGRIVRGEPVHGMPSAVEHAGTGLFAGLPNPMLAARYHSLVADPETIPDCLEVSASIAQADHSERRIVMAVAHRDLRTFGVQFHPESLLTPDGDKLIANFLNTITADR